ncbi:MAG: metallophosphoesterase [Candidatus Nezhaarchaeales archaeon]
MTLRIAAVADIHSPKNFELFKRALEAAHPDVDLFILAGDIILKGKVEETGRVISAIQSRYGCPIIACFGNEEFDEKKDILKDAYKGVIQWLDDEPLETKVKGTSLGIVGTRGSLDKPTSWQLKNVAGIRELYASRVERVKQLLGSLKCDVRILVSHYALTRKTMVGELRAFWPQLGSQKFEEVIEACQPDLAIHGHVHKGKVFEVSLRRTKVFNVALPATKRITIVQVATARKLPVQSTLLDFK